MSQTDVTFRSSADFLTQAKKITKKILKINPFSKWLPQTTVSTIFLSLPKTRIQTICASRSRLLQTIGDFGSRKQTHYQRRISEKIWTSIFFRIENLWKSNWSQQITILQKLGVCLFWQGKTWALCSLACLNKRRKRQWINLKHPKKSLIRVLFENKTKRGASLVFLVVTSKEILNSTGVSFWLESKIGFFADKSSEMKHLTNLLNRVNCKISFKRNTTERIFDCSSSNRWTLSKSPSYR